MDVVMNKFQTVILNKEEGIILRGQFPGSFCFVPVAFVEAKADGDIKVHRSRYLMSTWARRNVRLNPGRTIGSHLFPEEGNTRLSTDEAAVRKFLSRARTMIAP
ncbi:MAG: hypothetical protein RIQ79_725 [Verrucomicrobiota bacterium]